MSTPQLFQLVTSEQSVVLNPVEFISPEVTILKNSEILVTKEKIAEMTGVSVATVKSWFQKGVLPTVKVGKRTFCNCVALETALGNGVKSFKQGDFS